ncbi:MAG: proline--tRNA ligase, partial [bacterium]
VLARRDTGAKETYKDAVLIEQIKIWLENIQSNLYKRAQEYQKNKIVSVDTWEEFKKQIKNGNFVLAHWCQDKEIEKKIKDETKATIRSESFGQKSEKGKCVYSGKPSEKRVLFSLSY